MFKNLKVGHKIVLGFSAVILLMLAVGGAGYFGLSTAGSGFTEYREMARDTNLSGRLQANMLMVRMNVKDFILTGSDKDKQQYAEYAKAMYGFLDQAKKEIQAPERAKKIAFMEGKMDDYDAGFKEVTEMQTKRDELVNGVLNVTGPKMERELTKIMESAYKDKDAEAAFYGGKALRALLLARLYVVKFLDDNSQASVDRVRAEFKAFKGLLSDLDRRVENPARRAMLAEIKKLDDNYIKAFDGTVGAITTRNKIVSGTLNVIGPDVAKAVEDVKLDIKAAQDKLGPALVASNQRITWIMIVVSLSALVIGALLALVITRGITKPLNRIIAGLTDGSDQVASASNQVSASSQQLAEGSAQQAASLEETTSSMEEMASQTRANADNAQQADSLMVEAKETMNTAGQAMVDMAEAMEQISRSGAEIDKIVKSIDEIAFQTNLLALNAAVEAARAGEAGAGFAVVADEVRNLAMRAADAAKSTQSLIEDTVKRIDQGAELVTRTRTGFEGVTESVGKVSGLVAEIASASVEQSQGIEQVNQAMIQMDQGVQAAAANSEETASASEQLSSQAMSMKDMVGRLVTMVGGSTNGNGARKNYSRLEGSKRKAISAPATISREVRPEQVIPFDDDQGLGEF